MSKSKIDEFKHYLKEQEKIFESIIIFVDVRGFTKTAEKFESFFILSAIMEDFYNSIEKFNDLDQEVKFKSLGDGIMIIINMSKEYNDDTYHIIIRKIFEIIKNLDETFEKNKNELAYRYGYAQKLKLGWGLTQGYVKEIEIQNNNFLNKFEYLGADINKAARLCDKARPYGLVCDKEDFFDLLENIINDINILRYFNFKEIEVDLKGIGKIDVWASNELEENVYKKTKGEIIFNIKEKI